MIFLRCWQISWDPEWRWTSSVEPWDTKIKRFPFTCSHCAKLGYRTCTHQFSSLCDWKALRKDVIGQGGIHYWWLVCLSMCERLHVCTSWRILNDESLELVSFNKVVVGHGVDTPATQSPVTVVTTSAQTHAQVIRLAVLPEVGSNHLIIRWLQELLTFFFWTGQLSHTHTHTHRMMKLYPSNHLDVYMSGRSLTWSRGLTTCGCLNESSSAQKEPPWLSMASYTCSRETPPKKNGVVEQPPSLLPVTWCGCTESGSYLLQVLVDGDVGHDSCWTRRHKFTSTSVTVIPTHGSYIHKIYHLF